MKGRYSLVVFSLVIFLSGCATVEDAGQIAAGRQALFTGNNQAALSYFQSAAQTNPNCSVRRNAADGSLYLFRPSPIPQREIPGSAPVVAKSAFHAPG